MNTPTSPNLPEPATCEDCLTVELQRMTPGIFAGDLAMFPSPEGKYVRLSDAQLLAAEVERLRAERDGLVDMYQRLAESMDYTSGKDGMEFSPEEWGAALKADAGRYRWLRNEAHPDRDDTGIAVSEQDFNDWGNPFTRYFSGEALDAALDASRLALKEAP